MTLLTLAAGLFGLLIGSFLNVVIWRVPRGESIVRPASACPGCHRPIQARDNIPVISWLVLHGRCRACGEPIAKRYPAVELGTGLVFAGVASWIGLSWALPAYLYLAAVAVALAVIDLDVRRLPDVIVLPSYPIAIVLLALASWGESDWNALLRAVIGGAALFAFYFVLVLAYPAGMGFGDVKLAGLIGLYLAWIGWGSLVVGAFSAFVVGGLFAIGLVVLGRAGRKTGIPFGPWMLLGAACGVVWGESIWSGYLGIVLG